MINAYQNAGPTTQAPSYLQGGPVRTFLAAVKAAIVANAYQGQDQYSNLPVYQQAKLGPVRIQGVAVPQLQISNATKGQIIQLLKDIDFKKLFPKASQRTTFVDQTKAALNALEGHAKDRTGRSALVDDHNVQTVPLNAVRITEGATYVTGLPKPPEDPILPIIKEIAETVLDNPTFGVKVSAPKSWLERDIINGVILVPRWKILIPAVIAAAGWYFSSRIL